MGLFNLIGQAIGEVIVAPITITTGIIEGVEGALEELED